MIGVSFVVLIFSINSKLSAIEGAILFLGILIYTVFQIYESRKQTIVAKPEQFKYQKTDKYRGLIINLVLSVTGLFLLVIGSRLFVAGSIEIARAIGVSELVIGLTLVAAGTSLPELITSIVASIQGKYDIAVGNVIGSNIFNLMGVLGLCAIFSPSGIDVSLSALIVDLPIMVATAVACLPIFFTGHLISRWEGVLFFVYYIIYICYLLISAEYQDMPVNLNMWILIVVTPITVFTLIMLILRSNRKNKKS